MKTTLILLSFAILTLAAQAAAFVNDTFTDADSTALTSHTGETGATWTSIVGSGTEATIANNRMGCVSSASGAVYLASGTPPSANYYVEAQVAYLSGINSAIAIVGRSDAGGENFYKAELKPTNPPRLKLVKYVSGTPGVPAIHLGFYETNLVAGNTYTVRLDMSGTTIRVLLDGVERISVTDSSISAAGKAGVILYGGSATTTGEHLLSFTAE